MYYAHTSMDIQIVEKSLSRAELETIAKQRFGDFVKAVVDTKKEIMAVGGELHADAEALLIEHGSHQNDLWGINLYPGKTGDEFVEYDSMINIRPSQGNRSRGVDDPAVREKILAIVAKLITSSESR